MARRGVGRMLDSTAGRVWAVRFRSNSTVTADPPSLRGGGGGGLKKCTKCAFLGPLDRVEMHRRGGEGLGRHAQKPGGSGSQRNAQNTKKLQFQAQEMHRWGPPRGAEMHKRDPQGVRKCTKSVLEGSKNAQNNAQCRGNPPPPVHLLREGV